MEHNNERDDPSPLKRKSSTPSLPSIDLSPTFDAYPTPAPSVHQRPGYQRVPTLQEQDIAYHGATAEVVNDNEGSGLGIQNMKDTPQAPSIEVSFSNESSPAPGSVGFLLSPSLSRSSKKKYSPLGDTPEEDEEDEFAGRSRSPSLYRPFTADSETSNLRPPRTSTLSPYGPINGEHADFECMTKQHFHHARGEVTSVLILIASAFSTVFSAIWLGLATGKPHYGQVITHNSSLPPGTAAVLVAAFAKSIELTFVTTFVAFLGQLLSQRAFRKNSNGVTIAEMQMRQWILQPGTLITHFASVRYAAITLLGALAFIAALLAILYTTASDALVSPKLNYGSPKHRILYGNVSTHFANESYIEHQCASPIPVSDDLLHQGQTCIAIEHSGQAFHNYAQYLTDWTNALPQGSISTDMAKRPSPVGTLYDNTTVTGSWIDIVDMANNSKTFNRMVNNVTLAMPHAGIFAAAENPKNQIIQPLDLDGEYYLEASVPSPAINVLCAAMSKEELAPMVVSQWPAYVNTTYNVTGYDTETDLPTNSSWLNVTVVDGIFGFGEKYGRRSPIFPILPQPFNTILNYSGFPVVTDSIYLLATSNSSGDKPYALCSLRASLSPECSTEYHSTVSGGAMWTNCEDPHNELAYSRSQPSATSGVYNVDWRDVAVQWGLAVSLNAGKTDGIASIARMLTQFIPMDFNLDPKLPSIAEALAVLASCTLTMSTFDTPFLHYWNYSSPDTLLEPAIEPFNATLKVQDYSSGGTQHWQGIFYVVLASVFVLNLLCFGYFITHTGLVTDFMEPQNLFALSLNSPPSRVLEGTCGGGPRKQHYGSTWHIWMNRSEHFYIESTDDPTTRRRRHSRNMPSSDIELSGSKSPVSEMYNRLSKKRSSIL